MKVLVAEIDALLPQTQCGECGYKGCLPYAEAMAQGTEFIDRCPPGGVQTLNALAALLGVDPSPYRDKAIQQTRAPSVAVIRESDCVGCTKCIQACPVDAIVGSAKLMHTVLADDCTGCGLCVEPCPVDCIEMLDIEQARYDPHLARMRYHAKISRSQREIDEKAALYRAKRSLSEDEHRQDDKSLKKAYILEAMKRVKAKKNHE